MIECLWWEYFSWLEKICKHLG